jgi:hypothetical protein
MDACMSQKTCACVDPLGSTGHSMLNGIVCTSGLVSVRDGTHGVAFPASFCTPHTSANSVLSSTSKMSSKTSIPAADNESWRTNVHLKTVSNGSCEHNTTLDSRVVEQIPKLFCEHHVVPAIHLMRIHANESECISSRFLEGGATILHCTCLL